MRRDEPAPTRLHLRRRVRARHLLPGMVRRRAPRQAAFLTIGIGAYGDGSSPADRSSVCIEWRREGMRLTDEPARDRPELLGAFLPREAALAMPHINQLWHVADHIVLNDPRVSIVEGWLKAGVSR